MVTGYESWLELLGYMKNARLEQFPRADQRGIQLYIKAFRRRCASFHGYISTFAILAILY